MSDVYKPVDNDVDKGVDNNSVDASIKIDRSQSSSIPTEWVVEWSYTKSQSFDTREEAEEFFNRKSWDEPCNIYQRVKASSAQKTEPSESLSQSAPNVDVGGEEPLDYAPFPPTKTVRLAGHLSTAEKHFVKMFTELDQDTESKADRSNLQTESVIGDAAINKALSDMTKFGTGSVLLIDPKQVEAKDKRIADLEAEVERLKKEENRLVLELDLSRQSHLRRIDDLKRDNEFLRKDLKIMEDGFARMESIAADCEHKLIKAKAALEQIGNEYWNDSLSGVAQAALKELTDA